MVDFRQGLCLNSKPIFVIIFTNVSISLCKWVAFNAFNIALLKASTVQSKLKKKCGIEKPR